MEKCSLYRGLHSSVVSTERDYRLLQYFYELGLGECLQGKPILELGGRVRSSDFPSIKQEGMHANLCYPVVNVIGRHSSLPNGGGSWVNVGGSVFNGHLHTQYIGSYDSDEFYDGIKKGLELATLDNLTFFCSRLVFKTDRISALLSLTNEELAASYDYEKVLFEKMGLTLNGFREILKKLNNLNIDENFDSIIVPAYNTMSDGHLVGSNISLNPESDFVGSITGTTRQIHAGEIELNYNKEYNNSNNKKPLSICPKTVELLVKVTGDNSLEYHESFCDVPIGNPAYKMRERVRVKCIKRPGIRQQIKRD